MTKKTSQARQRCKVIKTKQFRKDFKRIRTSGRYQLQKLHQLVSLLANHRKLDPKYKDHHLKGQLTEWREFHLEGDWLLITP